MAQQRPSFWPLWLGLGMGVAAALFVPPRAHGMDHGFDKSDPKVKWFESLQRPDRQPAPCCGVADSYPVSRSQAIPSEHIVRVWIEDGSAKAYPDGTFRRPWDVSIPIDVPDYKINTESEQLSNPTNQGWLFFQPAPGSTTVVEAVYCYVPSPSQM